jgi:hypothetical protein
MTDCMAGHLLSVSSLLTTSFLSLTLQKLMTLHWTCLVLDIHRARTCALQEGHNKCKHTVCVAWDSAPCVRLLTVSPLVRRGHSQRCHVQWLQACSLFHDTCPPWRASV